MTVDDKVHKEHSIEAVRTIMTFWVSKDVYRYKTAFSLRITMKKLPQNGRIGAVVEEL